MGIESKPYWHEASEEEIKEFLSKGVTWDELTAKYEQPKWCGYYKALEGMLGCWALTTLEIRPKICPDFCKDCDSFIHTTSPASHEHE